MSVHRDFGLVKFKEKSVENKKIKTDRQYFNLVQFMQSIHNQPSFPHNSTIQPI